MTLRHGRMAQDEREQMRALAAQGKTCMEIAITLNRPFGTINSAVHRLKIPVKLKGNPWPAAEEAELIAMIVKGLSKTVIAKRLGRSPDSISGHIAALGGRRTIINPGADTQDPKPTRQPLPITGTADPYTAWRQAMARQAQRPAPPSQYA